MTVDHEVVGSSPTSRPFRTIKSPTGRPDAKLPRRGGLSSTRQMKKCTRCRAEKSFDSFPRRGRPRDGRASWCRDCFSDNWRGRYYANHVLYKRRHGESRTRLRGEKARRVYEYLQTHPCIDCGESDPVVLEFDHKVESGKLESVAQMIINNLSLENIFAEIQKCDVRCANCHRRRTAARFSYKRFLFNGRA